MIRQVKVIAFFYHEEVLARLFVQHYRWADCIHAVVSRSDDRTRQVLAAAPNVQIEDWEFPDGRLDDLLKTQKVNLLLAADQPYQWLIVVDADEFIWPAAVGAGGWKLVPPVPIEERANGTVTRQLLDTIPPFDSVVRAEMKNVFRHVTDGDLDLSRPPALQRRHGDPDQRSHGNAQYDKPILLRANRGFQLTLGNHGLLPNPATRVSWIKFEGAHWQNADPGFCVGRRIRDRRDRLSSENRRLGLGAQHQGISEADVLRVCRENEQCPQIF